MQHMLQAQVPIEKIFLSQIDLLFRDETGFRIFEFSYLQISNQGVLPTQPRNETVVVPKRCASAVPPNFHSNWSHAHEQPSYMPVKNFSVCVDSFLPRKSDVTERSLKPSQV